MTPLIPPDPNILPPASDLFDIVEGVVPFTFTRGPDRHFGHHFCNRTPVKFP